MLTALSEREFVDLKLVVLRFLARNELPSDIGRDLMALALRDASRNLRRESERDWQAHIAWVNGLGDDYFRRVLDECPDHLPGHALRAGGAAAGVGDPDGADYRRRL